MSSEECLKKNDAFNKHYKMGKEIGEGSFGTVYRAKNKREKTEYAVKVIRTKNDTDLKDARQEIQILKDLEHPHIVHYKEGFVGTNSVIVVMEYCEHGDVQERIKSRSSRPPVLDFFLETQVVEWAVQTCKALEYLHSKYILHRDLKPANLFLADKDVIKLGDFGIAKKLKDVVDVALSFVGTPLYISPEIVQLKPYNHKSDVWAAGCCFYEMMTLNNAVDPVPVRLSRQWNVRPMPLNYSTQLRDVVQSMLTIDCDQRPAIGLILQKLLCIQTKVDGAPIAAPRLHRPLPAPPLLANDSSMVTILPPTPDRLRPLYNESSPSSHRTPVDEMAGQPVMTMDYRMTSNRRSASLDSGTDGVGPTEAGQGRRSLAALLSDVKIDVQKNDSFWSISNSSIVRNLGALGVRFNDEGQLVEISGGRFQFNSFSDDKATNQMRYEEIGEQVTRYVYDLMDTKLQMRLVLLPIDASDTEPRSFIFVTDDYKTNDKKLLVLVHGPGVPRAGQWARRVIMNDSLAAGTQIPWIKQAIKEGYAVIVLNPNLNKHVITETPIRENEDGTKHALHVWDKVISTEVKAAKVVFAAHSAGSHIILQLATQREQEFKDRVVGIALADSHADFGSKAKSSVVDLFAKRATNWASSDKPLDTALTSDKNKIPKFSAGEKRHEWTAGSCIPSAVKFLNECCENN